MQQNKVKKAVALILALLLSMATGIVLFIGGLLLADHIDKTLSGIIAIVSFVLTVAALITNSVMLGKRRKKYNKMNFAEGHRMLLDRKSDIAQDLQSATERLGKTARAGKIYVSVITAIVFILIFFLGAQANASGGLFVYPILILFSISARFFFSEELFFTDTFSAPHKHIPAKSSITIQHICIFFKW